MTIADSRKKLVIGKLKGRLSSNGKKEHFHTSWSGAHRRGGHALPCSWHRFDRRLVRRVLLDLRSSPHIPRRQSPRYRNIRAAAGITTARRTREVTRRPDRQYFLLADFRCRSRHRTRTTWLHCIFAQPKGPLDGVPPPVPRKKRRMKDQHPVRGRCNSAFSFRSAAATATSAVFDRQLYEVRKVGERIPTCLNYRGGCVAVQSTLSANSSRAE